MIFQSCNQNRWVHRTGEVCPLHTQNLCHILRNQTNSNTIILEKPMSFTELYFSRVISHSVTYIPCLQTCHLARDGSASAGKSDPSAAVPPASAIPLCLVPAVLSIWGFGTILKHWQKRWAVGNKNVKRPWWWWSCWYLPPSRCFWQCLPASLHRPSKLCLLWVHLYVNHVVRAVKSLWP